MSFEGFQRFPFPDSGTILMKTGCLALPATVHAQVLQNSPANIHFIILTQCSPRIQRVSVPRAPLRPSGFWLLCVCFFVFVTLSSYDTFPQTSEKRYLLSSFTFVLLAQDSPRTFSAPTHKPLLALIPRTRCTSLSPTSISALHKQSPGGNGQNATVIMVISYVGNLRVFI